MRITWRLRTTATSATSATRAAAPHPTFAGQLFLGLRRQCFWVGFGRRDRGLDENLIAPNDRRGSPVTGNLRFPLHVVRFGPRRGWVGRRRYAGAGGPAPLWPILIRRRRGRARRREHQCQSSRQWKQSRVHVALKTQTFMCELQNDYLRVFAELLPYPGDSILKPCVNRLYLRSVR